MIKWKSNYSLILVTLLLVFSLAFIIYFYGIVQFPDRFTPLISFEKEYLSSRDFNLTSGNAVVLNLTISSIADEVLVIPFSLDLVSVFHGSFQEVDPVNVWCDYSFEPNTVIVGSGGSNSTLLTLEFFDVGDVVRFDFMVVPGGSDVHHVGGLGLSVSVVS
ncbi:MAG: hypothetical protein AC479_02915 [miscellaneous Crenarchaeota group-6 archaeon AD8-1]|nr:MAG: hypothetical protein AC479_02915 [miscellaneous Crenarchaeota group-6 archaeon AD8-1]